MGELIVNVSTGSLRGTIGMNQDGQEIYKFQGIPYAKPPLGPLRFKAPEPPEPWTGVRNAVQEGEQCLCRPSFDKTALRGGEDCLYLNVYTRELSTVRKISPKPVMFWIHGGGFTSGSGTSQLHGPEFLLLENIVLVTINYRTGLLGFLSFQDPSLEVPGNAGLKDMVLALKWVQQNIAQFGGDARNVTIFGVSAGAAACHYLVLSPMSKGLFHRAILQSGCALSCWAISKPYVQELAQILQLNTKTEREILHELRNMDAEKIYRAAENIPDDLCVGKIRPHGPVIERNPHGAFISEDPIEIIKSGKYNHVPIIFGFTSREGMINKILQKPKPIDFSCTVPFFLNIPKDSELHKKVAEKIKEFYYGHETPSVENKGISYLLDTDNIFLREFIRAVKLHRENAKEPVYLYRLSLVTSLNLLRNAYDMAEHGVCHADDLGYLFKNLSTPVIIKGSIEDIAIRRIVKLWTNFARNGDPNQKPDDLINIKWEQVTNKLNFLNIGENLTVGSDPEANRMAFWQDIFKMVPRNKL